MFYLRFVGFLENAYVCVGTSASNSPLKTPAALKPVKRINPPPTNKKVHHEPSKI